MRNPDRRRPNTRNARRVFDPPLPGRAGARWRAGRQKALGDKQVSGRCPHWMCSQADGLRSFVVGAGHGVSLGFCTPAAILYTWAGERPSVIVVASSVTS